MSWLVCLKVWLARGVAFGVVFTLCWIVNATGLREMFDVASLPLHKSGIPYLAPLADYEETRRFDLAHLYVLAVVLLSFYALEEVTGMYQDGREPTNGQRVTLAAGTALILLDAVTFWFGVRAGSLFTEVNMAVALISTIAYVCMLVVAANLISQLKRSRS